MKLDIQKIDDRIKKLQDLRKIAADPEMSSILVEFMTPEAAWSEAPAEPVKVEADSTATLPVADATADLIKDMVRGEAQPAANGLWSRRRG